MYNSIKIFSYYTLLFGILALSVLYGYYFSDLYFTKEVGEETRLASLILKGFWLLPIIYLLSNLYCLIFHPPFAIPKLKNNLSEFKDTLFIRYVTRGNNKKLIENNIKQVRGIMEKVKYKYIIEVVTDKIMEIEIGKEDIREIVVPEEYETSTGVKFKGRALQYAMEKSEALDKDYIIHLDEETLFDSNCINRIVDFIIEENNNEIPAIGQGTISYGKRGIKGFIHLLNTLTDSLRVTDDYGKFKLQFINRTLFFGIKGSFIVVRNDIEKKVGFDHGLNSSVTEDSYFGFHAKSQGIHFGYIYGEMKERSPFSVIDLIKQRGRWFNGLWKLILDNSISFCCKFGLVMMVVNWTFSPLSLIVVIFTAITGDETPIVYSTVLGFSFGLFLLSYVIGFFYNFDLNKLNLLQIIGLFILQIIMIPYFSIIETLGILNGIFQCGRNQFYIVNKEF